MKKLLLSVFALVFAASFTFAQVNTATVTQSGTNDADITQTNNAVGAGQDNIGTITVDGNGSDMDIIQTNNNSDASKDSDNVATITSTGDNNVGFIEQRNNPGGNNTVAGTITQTGDDHSATITQVGFNTANATVTQTVGNAEAIVDQRSTNGKDVVATVDQAGNNYASVSQTDNNLRVDIDQINTGGATGLRNSAIVTQGSMPSPGVVGARAWVTQEGENNSVTLDQANPSPFNQRADLDQLGNNNVIDLKQAGTSPSSFTVANISQEGDGNIVQGLDGNAQALQGSGSRVDATTIGNNNLIELEQGANNTATIMQGMGGAPSHGNTATVDQSTATGATATITQN